jgi:hypothetical protein
MRGTVEHPRPFVPLQNRTLFFETFPFPRILFPCPPKPSKN